MQIIFYVEKITVKKRDFAPVSGYGPADTEKERNKRRNVSHAWKPVILMRIQTIW